MLERIKKFTRIVNDFFAKVVLFIFYFLPLGFVAIFVKAFFFFFKKENQKTFWKKPEVVKFDKDYLKSPY